MDVFPVQLLHVGHVFLCRIEFIESQVTHEFVYGVILKIA